MGLDVIVTMRLPSEVVAHIDETVGRRGRSSFMRGAIVVALGRSVKTMGGEAVVRPVKKVVLGDDDVLLGALRGGGMTVRQAAEALGWMELRAVKAAGRLGDAGLVHYPRGMGIMEVK